MAETETMDNYDKKTLVFKITLADTSPEIWRRIHTPANITFHKLAKIIEGCMAWNTNGYPKFEMRHPLTSVKCNIVSREQYVGLWKPNENMDSQKTLVSEYFSEQNRTATFKPHNGWIHIVELEEIIAENTDPKKRARCVDGEGSRCECTTADEYNRKVGRMDSEEKLKHKFELESVQMKIEIDLQIMEIAEDF